MATSPSVRSVVLVHGALADGSCWSKVLRLLRPESFRSVALQLPNSSFADDVAAVTRALDYADGPVLLVGHSYAGAVISEAGTHDKVSTLVFVAAGAPDSGQSFNDWAKGSPPAPAASQFRMYGEGHVVVTEQGWREDLAQDATEDEAALLFATQKPLSVTCMEGKVTTAAWRSKPSAYIVATNDRGVSTEAQRASAERMKATVLELPTSHMPMLSKPAEVAAFIVQATKQQTGAAKA